MRTRQRSGALRLIEWRVSDAVGFEGIRNGLELRSNRIPIVERSLQGRRDS
jgi:hypothetical protein